MTTRTTESLTAADVGTLDLGKPPNAIITCSRCKKPYDKGAPAQPGQIDSSFVCDDCQGEHNAKVLAASAPTIVIEGNK